MCIAREGFTPWSEKHIMDYFFFFQAEDGIRDYKVTGVQTCALPISGSIRRLHEYLESELPFAWRIVIADNASSDETPRIAAALAEDLPNVELIRLPERGRGRALRSAWERSDAEVLCYMDVDLSTELRALLPLLAPL